MSSVYLLHFEPAYKHAQHYIGYTGRDDLFARLEEHRDGRGAKLCRIASQAGCTLQLARVWHGAERKNERQLKGRSLRPLCPICQTNDAMLAT